MIKTYYAFKRRFIVDIRAESFLFGLIRSKTELSFYFGPVALYVRSEKRNEAEYRQWQKEAKRREEAEKDV